MVGIARTGNCPPWHSHAAVTPHLQPTPAPPAPSPMPPPPSVPGAHMLSAQPCRCVLYLPAGPALSLRFRPRPADFSVPNFPPCLPPAAPPFPPPYLPTYLPPSLPPPFPPSAGLAVMSFRRGIAKETTRRASRSGLCTTRYWTCATC